MNIQEDAVIKGLLVKELKVVNKHLPRERLSLYKLMNMEIPYVILRDGTIHFFRKSELEMLSNYIEPDNWDKLLLPIIITIKPDIGEGIAMVEDSMAVKAIAKILGIELDSTNMKKLTLYKPHIAALRSIFDTVIQYALSIDFGKDIDDINSSIEYQGIN